jgi:hypothetical protein
MIRIRRQPNAVTSTSLNSEKKKRRWRRTSNVKMKKIKKKKTFST